MRERFNDYFSGYKPTKVGPAYAGGRKPLKSKCEMPKP